MKGAEEHKSHKLRLLHTWRSEHFHSLSSFAFKQLLSLFSFFLSSPILLLFRPKMPSPVAINGTSILTFPVSDFSTITRASALPLPLPSSSSPVSPINADSVLHKEVAAELELLDRKRKRHTKPGQVPYPVVCDSATVHLYAAISISISFLFLFLFLFSFLPLRVTDPVWRRSVRSETIDHLIITDLFGGLTLKPLDTPPARVLDLGCGVGAWVLSAAHEWKARVFLFPSLAIF